MCGGYANTCRVWTGLECRRAWCRETAVPRKWFLHPISRPFLRARVTSHRRSQTALFVVLPPLCQPPGISARCKTTPEYWISPSRFTDGETEAQESSMVSQEVSGGRGSRIPISVLLKRNAFHVKLCSYYLWSFQLKQMTSRAHY